MINTINHNINIDLANKTNINQSISIKKNDTNSHKFVINIFNNSAEYPLTGTTARMYFQKSDKTKVFLDCILDNALTGKISCLLTTQALSYSGLVASEITIYGSAGEVLTSLTFNFIVSEVIRDDAAIQSTSEFTALTNALMVVTTIANKLDKTEFTTFKNATDATLANIPQQTYITEKAKQVDLIVTNTNVTSNTNSIVGHTTSIANNTNAIASLASGSPKGTYATLSAITTAFPTGNTNTYLTTDGKWNYWNGSVWTIGGVYQATPIADGELVTAKYRDISVTPAKVSFFKTGKNLFNLLTAIMGYFVDETNGTLAVNATYNCSYFIRVQPLTIYTRGGDAGRIAFYGLDKVFISGLPNGALTLTIPANCYYIRYSFYTSISTMQFELGSIATYYNSFVEYIPKELLEDKPFNITSIASNSLEANQTKFILTSKNGFDKSRATLNKYIDSGNGNLSYHAILAISDYISVIPGQTWITNKSDRSVCFFNALKTYVSGIDAPPNIRVIPNGCYFMIVNPHLADIDVFQIELGTVSTSFEAFYYKLDKSLGGVDEFKTFLPSEICVAVGRTIEIYNNQVTWCGNINNYHFKWDCTIGKNMKRKFSITGTTPLIGEYPLIMTVYDNNMNVVATASSTIKIVSAIISNAKNILNIGDSLSNNKAWLGELRTLSANQFTMIGTRGTAPLKHEGRSGFWAIHYLTATPYTYEGEGMQPFWDGTRFSLAYYKTQTGLVPNAIQLFLGTNGMELDPTTNANNIKQIVDNIRLDDATIPIFLVYTLYRGNQDGIGNELGTDGYMVTKGSWELQEDRKVFNLMVRLNTLLKLYTNLHFVPICACHDSEYNFGGVATPVNPRASQTELLPVQATHPQDQGYLQFADIMFSSMAKYLNS